MLFEADSTIEWAASYHNQQQIVNFIRGRRVRAVEEASKEATVLNVYYFRVRI
jgi:hypothetical protein